MSRAQYDAIQAREVAARKVAEAQERPSRSVGHPGFAESLIPVWGSGREAVADFQEGDYAGGALNTALAASDLFAGGAVAKGVIKGGKYALKASKSVAKDPYAWKNVRRWMGKEGILDSGQHGHHWLIPQNGWGKNVPTWIKNHPLNIKGMSDPVTHWRIDHRVGDLPRFNPAQRYWYGTPDWAKAAAVGAVGHPVGAVKARSDRR